MGRPPTVGKWFFPKDEKDRVTCRVLGCGKSFVYQTPTLRTHVAAHGYFASDPPPAIGKDGFIPSTARDNLSDSASGGEAAVGGHRVYSVRPPLSPRCKRSALRQSILSTTALHEPVQRQWTCLQSWAS